jgi:periplasmic protein TonB
MLDDFSKTNTQGARRFGASLAASVALYGSVGAGVVAASAVARHVVVQEELVQVEFAQPPPPVEAPPPPPVPSPEVAPSAPARLGRPRPQIAVPTEIPSEAPRPSSAPAPPSDPFAPEGEGSADGAPGGTGSGGGHLAAASPAPAPPASRPSNAGPVRVLDGTSPARFDRAALQAHLQIPDGLRSAGLSRITVTVRVTVGADSHVTHVDVLRGHPLLPDENVARAYRETTADEPCRMQDGTPYACVLTQPFTLAFTL